MLIFRYLAKEIFVTLASLVTILLLIFMSNQFVQYLNRAANGKIPGMIILKLMMLELPNLMGLLLPLGFYVALLIAYGRLYAENEMTVLQACGYGPPQLLKHSLVMATGVSLFVGVIMFWLSPSIATERARLLNASGVKTLIQLIAPGKFRAESSGRDVFYVQSISRNHSIAQHVFLARQTIKENKAQWDVLWAERAYAKTDPSTFEDYLVLKNGKEYEGVPGQADYQIAEFESYSARLPHPTVTIKKDIRTEKTSALLPFFNQDINKVAELQWRISIPMMVIILTFIAVPLSRVNPRAGKFAKLLPAIIIYIIYANFMFLARNWLATGKFPEWMGIWWLHAIFLLLGLFLYQNQAKKT